jgi:thiosulfate/3-mercaptopyruvate sulfurtransferase
MILSIKEAQDWIEQGAICFDARFRLQDPNLAKKLYLEGHIPGAYYLDLEKDLSGSKNGKNGRHPMPSRQQLKELFSKFGVHEGSKVLIYDDTDHAGAARAWILFRWMGFSSVAVLNGGFSAWVEAGFAKESGEVFLPKPSNFLEKPSLVNFVFKNELADKFVVDARAPERFRGEVEPIDSKAGHIPSAFNCFYGNLLDEKKKFRSKDELEALLPKEKSVFSCGSGVTACVLLLAAHHIGRSESIYPGSWSEWIAEPAGKVEVGEYRFGVMAVIRNNGKYLLLERADRKGSWQFPQGGWEARETLEEAVIREVQEEVGIRCQVTQRGKNISQYDWPKPWVRENRRGQKHFWFLCETTEEPKIPMGDGSFQNFQWVALEEVLDRVVEFKRDAYQQGLAGFLLY